MSSYIIRLLAAKHRSNQFSEGNSNALLLQPQVTYGRAEAAFAAMDMIKLEEGDCACSRHTAPAWGVISESCHRASCSYFL